MLWPSTTSLRPIGTSPHGKFEVVASHGTRYRVTRLLFGLDSAAELTQLLFAAFARRWVPLPKVVYIDGVQKRHGPLGFHQRTSRWPALDPAMVSPGVPAPP